MPRPDSYQGQVVGQSLLSVPFQAGPDHRRSHKTADAGGKVDDVASREVAGTLLRPVTAAP